MRPAKGNDRLLSFSPVHHQPADCDDDQIDALLAGGVKYSAIFDMLANPTEINISRTT